MKKIALVGILASLATPILAEGDAANGETLFARQCVACHVVVNDAGETLAGRTARTGPNLFGIEGRQMGSVEGFRYGTGLLALNEQAATWDEESFVAYVQDPTTWLREILDDSSARSKMSFRVRQEQDAADIYAFLASLSE